MPFKSFELAQPDDPIFSGGVKVFATRKREKPGEPKKKPRKQKIIPHEKSGE